MTVTPINDLNTFAQWKDLTNAIADLSNTIGDVASLSTTAKNTTVAAINEVKTGVDNITVVMEPRFQEIEAEIGNLANLATTDKSNIVNAINEIRTPTINLPMSGKIHTGVGNATARSNYGVVGQIQDGTYIYAGTSSGASNIFNVTLSIAPSTIQIGQVVRFIAHQSSSGASQFSVNGSTLASILSPQGNATTSGSITNGSIVEVVWNGASWQLIALSNPVGLSGTQTIGGNKTFSNVIAVPSGSSASPSMNFTGDTSTGVFRSSAGVLAISAAGTVAATFSATLSAFPRISVTTGSPTQPSIYNSSDTLSTTGLAFGNSGSGTMDFISGGVSRAIFNQYGLGIGGTAAASNIPFAVRTGNAQLSFIDYARTDSYNFSIGLTDSGVQIVNDRSDRPYNFYTASGGSLAMQIGTSGTGINGVADSSVATLFTHGNILLNYTAGSRYYLYWAGASDAAWMNADGNGSIEFYTGRTGPVQRLWIRHDGIVTVGGAAPVAPYNAVGDVVLPATSKIRSLNTPKAWVKFGPTGAIISSFNVSSVTYGPSGILPNVYNYQINCTNNVSSSTNACVVSSTGVIGYSSHPGYAGIINTSAQPNQSTIRLAAFGYDYLNGGWGLTQIFDHAYVVIFGDV